jgi:hypothetical protein
MENGSFEFQLKVVTKLTLLLQHQNPPSTGWTM